MSVPHSSRRTRILPAPQQPSELRPRSPPRTSITAALTGASAGVRPRCHSQSSNLCSQFLPPSAFASRQQPPFEEATADFTSLPWPSSRPRCCPLPVTPLSPQTAAPRPSSGHIAAGPSSPPPLPQRPFGQAAGAPRTARTGPDRRHRAAVPASIFRPLPPASIFRPVTRPTPAPNQDGPRRIPAPGPRGVPSQRPYAGRRGSGERTKRGAACGAAGHEAGPAALVSAEGRGHSRAGRGAGGASCSVRGGSTRPCPRRPQPCVGILEVRGGGGEDAPPPPPPKKDQSMAETKQTKPDPHAAERRAPRVARPGGTHPTGRAAPGALTCPSLVTCLLQ